MSNSLIITESEIREGIERYDRAMHELADLLNGTLWTYSRTVSAFERWAERRAAPWQVLVIEAKHAIKDSGIVPWELT